MQLGRGQMFGFADTIYRLDSKKRCALIDEEQYFSNFSYRKLSHKYQFTVKDPRRSVSGFKFLTRNIPDW